MSDNGSNGPVVLCIVDGWGERAADKHNAMHLARTPSLDDLRTRYPWTTLEASGPALGLRQGQPGDGELGHRILGAGRVLEPLHRRIDKLALDNYLGRNDMVDHLFRLCTYNDYALHLFGLLSHGGRHAHMEHLISLIETASFNDVPVVVHAFTDGREASQQSTMNALQILDTVMEGRQATLGTISGRYYAMDRGLHWDRTYKAFHAIVRDKVLDEPAPEADTAFEAVSWAYQQGLSDDMIPPTRIGEYRGMKGDFMCDFSAQEPAWQWQAEAAGLFFNVRGDRVHQLAAMMMREVPPEVANDLLTDRHKAVCVFEHGQLGTLTHYGDDLRAIVGFQDEHVTQSLGEVIAEHGMRQLRCAEMERRAHVTTFFNGGRITPFEGEERAIVGSSKLVERYEEKPAMSAVKIADAAIQAIETDEYAFILVHFSNLDELGHGGNLAAVVEGAEAVDAQLGRLAQAVRRAKGSLLITSSHGNCEQMKDDIGEPLVAHTTNPVPLIYVKDGDEATLRAGGSLADVAATVLDVLGIAPPPSMTGRTLRVVPS